MNTFVFQIRRVSQTPSRPLLARPPGKRRVAAGLLQIALALGLAGLAQAQTAAPSKPVLVAAAANLQQVLAELVPLFEREKNGKLSLNIGSSANLVRQIQQGLPAELFLSADEDFALRLADAGLTLAPQLTGLKAGLSPVRKFAIANPELAPYGKAAQQALQKLAIWPALQGKIVLGENIAQTTQYVSTGAAEAGITALSLVLAPEVATRVRYVLIPDELHAPIRQRMVLLKNASPGAQAFYDFLQSAPAQAVLARYGFR